MPIMGLQICFGNRPHFILWLRHQLCGARGMYYPRGPFAVDLQHLPLQRVHEKQGGQKDKGERGYRMAVLTESLFLLIIIFVKP